MLDVFFIFKVQNIQLEAVKTLIVAYCLLTYLAPYLFIKKASKWHK